MTGSAAPDLQGVTLEIIPFHLGGHQFCTKTTSIRKSVEGQRLRRFPMRRRMCSAS